MQCSLLVCCMSCVRPCCSMNTVRRDSNSTLMYSTALLSLCVIFLYDSTFFSKIWTLNPSSFCRVKKKTDLDYTKGLRLWASVKGNFSIVSL